MTALTLRAARSTDAGKLGAILSEFIDETPWMPRIHTRAQDVAFAGQMIDQGWISVATRGAGPLGFLARNGSFIHALYVAGAARGQGVGQALLEGAKAAVPRLELWTFDANTGAQRFYERAGFATAERTNGSGNDEGLPDIRYVWSAAQESPAPEKGQST